MLFQTLAKNSTPRDWNAKFNRGGRKAYRADTLLKFLYETSNVEIGDLCLKFVILIVRGGDFTREDPLLWRCVRVKLIQEIEVVDLSLSLTCSLSEDLPVSVYKVKGIRGQRSRRNCNSIFDFFILFIDGLLETPVGEERADSEIESELNSPGVRDTILFSAESSPRRGREGRDLLTNRNI